MTITTGLWERWGRLTATDLPADVDTVARQCILDWFACAVAGSAEPLSRILREELVTAEGEASIVGTGQRSGARTAALVNGAASHALDDWLLPQTLFKYHAACYLTHAAIEATASLGPAADAVERITVTVNPGHLDVCAIPRPRTGLEAKFSLTATTAFTVLGIDTTDPASFVDGHAADGRVRALIERVDVDTDPELRNTQVRVEVVADGRTRVAEYDTGVPATDLDAQGAKLRAKFSNLVEPLLGGDAKALAERIEHVTALPSTRQLVSG